MSVTLRRPAWWPLALAFAWFAATLGARPLAVPDEGRYAGVAWNMVTGGDWLVPRLDGLPYFHKPPLFYWITAAAMQLAGPVEWAARIAPLLGAMAGATAVYLFARRWHGERFARLALFALATQVLAFIGAQFANLDMLVAGCITVTVLALAHGALRIEEGGRPHAALAAAYLFAALGVLAKGLIGLVIPGLVIVAWLLLQGRWRMLLALLWWPGVLLLLAVAAPWFVLMQGRFDDFSRYFFYVQHFARYLQGGFNNRQPAYFYPAVLLLLAFPWSLWVLGALRRGARAAAAGPVRLLAWTWLVATLAFFSLPESKLIGYILPAAFPLALLAADAYVHARVPLHALPAWWRASAALAVVACVVAVAYGTLRPLHSARAIGVALRAAAPDDRIVFVRHYWFDVPVYARLRRPVVVLDDWSRDKARRNDNWRKELADAGDFDAAAAASTLWPLADAARVLCTSTATWIVGERQVTGELPMLAAATLMSHEGELRLWRLDALPADARRPGCPASGAELPGPPA